MKLFGKELFNFKKEEGSMYDFAQHGLINGMGISDFTGLTTQGVVETSQPRKSKKKKDVITVTPKGIYHMKALNANNFVIKIDPDYLAEQIKDIKLKQALMGKIKKPKKNRWGEIMSPEFGGVRFAKEELASILERLENRSRIKKFADILEKYPHTTSELIDDVISKNQNLRCELAEAFVPDFPKEAINAMKEYREMCIELCNKKPIFYVIAQTKDFEKKNKRRDPILLAQSPFGFFWQILGAYDEEMVYLGDL